ncbi:MAG: VWA domain-containing protein [Planctomycetes bacterium]|nr:VWA domain-containing protein [Planctomycetota bacterium]
MCRRQAAAIATALIAALPGSRLGADDVAREHAAALKDLSGASAAGDTDELLRALKVVLEGDDPRSVRSAVAAYSKIRSSSKLEGRELMTFHGKAAAAFAAVKSKRSIEELEELLVSHGDWHGRLLLLDASGVAKGFDRLQSCLRALQDEHPVVIRRALQYLAHAKKPEVVDAIVTRYLNLAKAKRGGGEASQWDRTLLACQSALQQLLKVDLAAPEDYKNYFEARRNDPNLFSPEKCLGEATGVTLFGAAVTGKNIIFVLDISGSMLTIDPTPVPKEKDPERGRTVVAGVPGGGQKPKRREPPEERQRMARAKRELARVVRSLPSDVRFNVVTYSSDVGSWKKAMVPASDSNKKSAVEHIEGLVAEGITVTDMALEEAFSDLNVDTIYLVTDGAPTHIGTTTPGLPEDALQIIEQIHERTAELNYLRGVRIFALGFREAHEEFLKKLAADHAGRYVRID